MPSSSRRPVLFHPVADGLSRGSRPISRLSGSDTPPSFWLDVRVSAVGHGRTDRVSKLKMRKDRADRRDLGLQFLDSGFRAQAREGFHVGWHRGGY
jgi:hypothetical protein